MASLLDPTARGRVILVGAGPGDPGLLTVRAVEALKTADVVVHDGLIDPRVLDLAPPQAQRISVAKRRARHTLSQDAINALIVAHVKTGAIVVRLKGGDPSIFGRSTEELDACRAAGVPVKVCPGITAASAAVASAGTSLTLRGVARRLTLVTAHAQAGATLDLDWPTLAATDSTLAIYMGRAAAATVAQQLVAAGRSPDTPVLVVVNASLSNERIIRGRLSALAFLVEAISAHDPAMLIVGEAVEADPSFAHAQSSRARDGILIA